MEVVELEEVVVFYVQLFVVYDHMNTMKYP